MQRLSLKIGLVALLWLGIGSSNYGQCPKPAAFVTEFGDKELSAVVRPPGIIATLASELNTPFGVALNAAETTAFVTENRSGELSKIDLDTGTITLVASGLDKPLVSATH